MEDALLRDDAADQEGDQQDDGHGLPGHAVELIDGRGQPELARAHQHAQRRHADGAEHVGEQHEVVAEREAGLADAGEEADDGVLVLRLGRCRAIDAVHLLEQAAVVRREPEDDRLAPGRGSLAGEALEQPGAERVELAHAGHVDRHILGFGGFAGNAIDQSFKLSGVRCGPGSEGEQLETLSLQLAFQQDFAHGNAPSRPCPRSSPSDAQTGAD